MHRHDAKNEKIEGLVIHTSRLYDTFAWFIRKTDKPILDLAEVSSGDRVLDIGTGPGYLARAAAARVGPDGRAVGLDASPEMVERAQAHALAEGQGATFVLAGAQKMPFENGSFDVVVSRLAMHHIPADVKGDAMDEIARVLAPGGRMVLTDLKAQTLGGLLHDAVRHLHGAGPVERDSLQGLADPALYGDVTTGRIGLLSYVKARKL